MASQFNPEDENLVFYLMYKMSDDINFYREGFHDIRDIDIYKHQPENLPTSLTYYSDRAKVYFTLSERKQRRKVEGGGSWRQNVAEKRIGKSIARKSTLVYYDKNEEETPWRMEQYILDAPKNKEPKMDSWTLCVVYDSRE